MSKRREIQNRRQDERRHDRAVRQVACQQVGLHFGPIRLGSDSQDQVQGHTQAGEAVAWLQTTNGEAIVPAGMMS